MKTFTQFLTALAVLAIVQYVTVALGIVLLIVAVMAASIHPRQAFATAVLIGLLALAIKQPVACAAGLGTIWLAGAVTKRVRRPTTNPAARTTLMLTHAGEPPSR